MIIIENKQVGTVSYMCTNLDQLSNILKDEEILGSRKPELNPDTGKKSRYVSFSRNLTSAGTRNPKRWRFGVVLDGDKISDRYSIVPFSYAGVQAKYSDLRVKWMAAYDDGTYALNLVNWATVPINRNLYNSIKNEIENMDPAMKEKKKLEHTFKGKKRVNGRLLIEKYLFNVPSGGLRLTARDYPSLCATIAKSESFNETEERVWLSGSNLFVSIKNCIKGIILPKNMTNEEKLDFEELVQPIMDQKNISNIIRY